MHEHRFLIAHHNLPGPSECEGPRQFPSFADADGIADNVELMAGADPLDADEDGDGIPDGLSPDAYAANPLWAESAEDANLSIVLLSAIPADGSATLVVGGLALPLRNPSTYILTLPPGEYVPFRLLSRNAGTVDLAFGDPPSAPLMRGGGNASRDLPVWARDPMGVFKGAAEAGSGALAIPVVHLRDRRGLETETSECVHKRRNHVAWQDMDGNGVADKDDGYLVPGSETVEFTAIGSTAGECCCGLDTGPESLTARLVSHSSNLRLWDASGALLGTDDSLRTFRIQATAPSPSLDGSTVRYEIVGPTNDVRSAMTIRVTAWDMWCTGLAFNHDTTTNSVDAINLRRNFNNAIDYSISEWACTASHSSSPVRNEPACWIAGTTPTVKGRFVVRPTDITNAVIGAWHLGPILSSAAASSVVFSNGVTHASGATNHADFATFPLSSPIPAKVSRSTFEWLGWYATELNGQSASGFIGITVPSVVYSILGAPVAPWSDVPGVSSNAWVSALDFAITNACEGTTSATNALASLTMFLFAGYGLTYDTQSGSSSFCQFDHSEWFTVGPIHPTVNLSKFLKGYGATVNCYDQAAMLTSLGTLLGTEVFYRYLEPFGYINTIALVGVGDCNNPFFNMNTNAPLCAIVGENDVFPNRYPFGNHAFCSFNKYVFDACAGPSLGQFSVGEYLDNVIDHISSVTNVPMAEVSTNCCGVGKTPVIGSIKALE